MNSPYRVARAHAGFTRLTVAIWLTLMGSMLGCTEPAASQEKGVPIAGAAIDPASDADGPVIGKEELWDAHHVDIYVVSFFDLMLKSACDGTPAIDVSYQGTLARTGPGLRPTKFEWICLRWSIIQDEEPLFDLVLSPRQLEDRVDQIRLGNRVYSVAVDLKAAADLEASVEREGLTIRRWVQDLCRQIDKCGSQSPDEWSPAFDPSPGLHRGTTQYRGKEDE